MGRDRYATEEIAAFALRATHDDLDGDAAPDRAALVNGCLVRYVDYMDNIASEGEVCHPSDNARGGETLEAKRSTTTGFTRGRCAGKM